VSLRKETIVFIDNSIHGIFKSLDELGKLFQNIKAFNNEKDGLEFVNHHPIDLLFLNLDLSPLDGVSITKEITQIKNEPRPFIIVYSDKQDDYVQEMVFNSGADSFINFHNKPEILGLFIRNLLRHRKTVTDEKQNRLILDKEKYLVFKQGAPFQLPRKEFRVFELLFNNPGKFFSKEEIAVAIWNDKEIAKKRIIDVHMYNIRRFFGKRVIQSQKGKGYKLNEKYF